MIGRRFFGYFVVVTGLLAAFTALYVRYSLGRAVEDAVAQNLLYARSISQYLVGRLEEDGQALQRMLAALPDPADDEQATALLESTREGLMGRARVAVLDDHGRVLASDLAQGLAPPEVLLPALRQARESETGGPVVTDLWRDPEGRPRVALIVARGSGEEPKRFALAQVPLDSEDFLRVFGYFLVNQRTSLELLDSQGTALFSTRREERFRSAVHGTFFIDKVRQGEPAVMTCHSCHVGAGKPDPVRMVTTVAPVAHTRWAIAILERESDVYATMRTLVLSAVGLVALFFGGFSAFYFLLSRRVLRPMRDLSRAAAAIASGQNEALPLPDAGDEFGVLARSFETMQRRVAASPHTPQEDAELRSLVEEVIEGLSRLEAVRSVALCVTRQGGAPIYVSRYLELRASRPLFEVFSRLSQGRRWIGQGELQEAGVEVVDAGGVSGFHVRELDAREGGHGYLWIGTEDAGDGAAAYLSPAVDVLAHQVKSLLERAEIFDRLRREHQLRGRIVRRLFDAEDEERRRIARELHDETAQLLTSLLLHLETFPPPGDARGQQRALDVARQRVHDLLDEIHRLIQRLRPAVLDDLGLIEAIRSLGRNVLARAGIELELTLDDDGTEAPLPPEIENAVYRVFQEAATNAIRHAGARHVQASIERSRELLRATFEDDGKGMDLSWLADATTGRGWGMIGMRERVVQIGGTIRFSRGESGGLRIEVEVPLQPAAEQNGRDPWPPTSSSPTITT